MTGSSGSWTLDMLGFYTHLHKQEDADLAGKLVSKHATCSRPTSRPWRRRQLQQEDGASV